MAKRQVSVSAQGGPEPSLSHDIKEQFTGTRKEPLEVRRSARLKDISQLEGGSEKEPPKSGPSLTSEASRNPARLNKSSLKRKRDQEAPLPPLPAQEPLPSQRARTSTRHTAEGRLQEIEKHSSTTVDNPVKSWVLDETWPREYFEPDVQTRAELLERDSSSEDVAAQPPAPEVRYVERDGFRYPLPIKMDPASLRRKQSDSSLTESSEQTRRESKSTPYRNPRYTTILETKGSFLRDFSYKIPRAITDICNELLEKDQIVPQNSLFRDDIFDRVCWKIQDRNEAMVIQDVTRLIVPSAMNLAIYGDTHLDVLIESANEAWTNSIPVEGPRPQPDYAVGFDRSAFTKEQLNKLGPLIGSVFDTSFFVATHRMYFPFLTCEVKCSASALDIADRQNAHSMTIAVRSVVELYRAVKREKELDREILAFSFSHDHSAVRIYGHYAVITDSETTYYRHPIKKFDFASEQGAEKWTGYKFAKSVYDFWMPTHLKRICSAIDQLPSGIDFQVSGWPEVQPEAATSLPQHTGSPLSDPGSVSLIPQEYDELNPIPQTATPTTSVSKGVGDGAARSAKKPRITKEPTGRRDL